MTTIIDYKHEGGNDANLKNLENKMSDITITDVATVVENSGVTDNEDHADAFIDWLWVTTGYHELQDICADRYPKLDAKFRKFSKETGIDE